MGKENNLSRLSNILSYFHSFSNHAIVKDLEYFFSNDELISILDSPILKENYILHEDMIIKKEHFSSAIKEMKFSEKMLKKASIISDFLSANLEIKSICVTGSLAFKNARKDDDIDLLIITEEGKLWQSLFKIFLLNRMLSKRLKVRICVNFVATPSGFMDFLNKEKNPLIFYEAFKAIPLKGEKYYYGLLSHNYKLKRFFENKGEIILEIYQNISFKNYFFYILLSFYLNILKIIRNLKILKYGKINNEFDHVLKENLYMIKSKKYEIIKKLFENYISNF